MGRETFTLRWYNAGQTAQLAVNYTERYDAAANCSVLTLSSLEFGGLTGHVYGKLFINETEVAALNERTHGNFTLSAAEVTVPHRADGSGSFTLRFAQLARGYTLFYVETASGKYIVTERERSIPLTPRARASSILALRERVKTAERFPLQVERRCRDYFHRASVTAGEELLFESEPFAESAVLTLPRSMFENHAQESSLAATLAVQTYSDESCSVAIGEADSRELLIEADEGLCPQLSEGWVRLAPLQPGEAEGIEGYIEGVSRVRAVFEPSKLALQAGAAVDTFSLSLGGERVECAPYVSAVLGAEATLTAAVTDSRGLSASESITLPILPYRAPTLGEVKVLRCRADGTADEAGTYYSVKASAVFSALGGQNGAELAVFRSEGETWADEGALTDGERRVLGPISADKSYRIRLSVRDRLGRGSKFTAALPSRSWAMKFRPDGRGVAFGKAAERERALELPQDWELYFGEQPLRAVQRNFLDNACFCRAVNQRGQSAYRAPGITLDRWRLTEGEVALTAAGITLRGARLIQRIEEAPLLQGRTVTLSALGEWEGHCTGSFGESLSLTLGGLNVLQSGSTLTISGSGELRALKLELGSRQSLSSGGELLDIPHYGESLRQCGRYLAVYGQYARFLPSAVGADAIDFLVPLPQALQGPGHIEGAEQLRVMVNASAVGGFSFSIAAQSGNILLLRASKQNHGLAQQGLWLEAAGRFALSAEE